MPNCWDLTLLYLHVCFSKTMVKTDDITVGIKTFYRPGKLKRCLQSLVDKNFFEVVVADDGEITSEKKAIYTEFARKLPLKLLRLPFDSGLAYGRNQIVKVCKTPFLLMLDDDQRVDTDIFRLKKILLNDSSLGGVSGFLLEENRLKCEAHNLYIRNGYLIRHIQSMPEPKKLGKLTYYIFDQIPNSTLFRTECVQSIGWDNFFKIGREHVDFYLTHKKAGKWKFAVTPNVIIKHEPKGEEIYKKKYRLNPQRIENSNKYFLKKWGLKGIIEGKKLLVPYGIVGKQIARIKILMLQIGVPLFLIEIMQKIEHNVGKWLSL